VFDEENMHLMHNWVKRENARHAYFSCGATGTLAKEKPRRDDPTGARDSE
jgi:hypothetical protein